MMMMRAATAAVRRRAVGVRWCATGGELRWVGASSLRDTLERGPPAGADHGAFYAAARDMLLAHLEDVQQLRWHAGILELLARAEKREGLDMRAAYARIGDYLVEGDRLGDLCAAADQQVDLVRLLAAFATARHHHPRLMDAAADAVLQHWDTWETQHLDRIGPLLHSFGRLMHAPDALVDKICTSPVVQSSLVGWREAHLDATVWSYARVTRKLPHPHRRRERHAAFFAAVARAAASNVDGYIPVTVGNLLFAFASTGHNETSPEARAVYPVLLARYTASVRELLEGGKGTGRDRGLAPTTVGLTLTALAKERRPCAILCDAAAEIFVQRTHLVATGPAAVQYVLGLATAAHFKLWEGKGLQGVLQKCAERVRGGQLRLKPQDAGRLLAACALVAEADVGALTLIDAITNNGKDSDRAVGELPVYELATLARGLARSPAKRRPQHLLRAIASTTSRKARIAPPRQLQMLLRAFQMFDARSRTHADVLAVLEAEVVKRGLASFGFDVNAQIAFACAKAGRVQNDELFNGLAEAEATRLEVAAGARDPLVRLHVSAPQLLEGCAKLAHAFAARRRVLQGIHRTPGQPRLFEAMARVLGGCLARTPHSERHLMRLQMFLTALARGHTNAEESFPTLVQQVAGYLLGADHAAMRTMQTQHLAAVLWALPRLGCANPELFDAIIAEHERRTVDGLDLKTVNMLAEAVVRSGRPAPALAAQMSAAIAAKIPTLSDEDMLLHVRALSPLQGVGQGFFDAVSAEATRRLEAKEEGDGGKGGNGDANGDAKASN